MGFSFRVISVGLAVMAACLVSPSVWAEDKAGLAPIEAGSQLTALDHYVRTPDPNYRYELVKTIDGDGFTGYILHMVSQEWLMPEEIDRTLWEHTLEIVRPDNVESDIGMLYIGGGDNDDDPRENVSGRIVGLAMATGTVTAQLYHVPNQPLVFTSDPRKINRSEDAIIAYTWDKYLQTGDEKWPLRLPMTKSAVRAMDTITSFMGSGQGGFVEVEKFVVAGGSKRGWTTWTTAAVDKRVVGIAPIVIDMLNLIPSFIHHYEVYGRYARAVADYQREDVMDWTGTPEYERLMQLVDPFSYRARLTMPKYIINSTGDQFFIPDSSQFYWDELVGEKILRYVPNADHSLGGTDAGDNLLSWYHAIVHDIPRPRYSWSIDAEGAIHVLTLDEPREVRLWQATNPEARNFQKRTIGDAYTSTVLPALDKGIYVGRITPPEKGWTAYFVELTFESGTVAPFKFTTEVKVWPEEKPFKFKYATADDHAVGFMSK